MFSTDDLSSLRWDPVSRAVEIIDQTLLPHTLRWVHLDSLEAYCHAISAMQVQGAPLIGITAAFGLASALSAQTQLHFFPGAAAGDLKGIEVAILGDANAVNFVPLTAAERFTAVQTGTVDLLMRNTTWTQSRDTDVGMDFGPTTYYDGQQLMARAGDGFSGADTVADIDGAVVCTNAGTTTEKNISDAAAAAGVSITLNTFEDFDIVTDNFISGACDIVTTDGSALVGRKAEQQPDGEEWVIFPPTPISKEPLGPTYGQNDSAWADVINWSVYATIIADEKGITSANAGDIVGNADFDAESQRLMGGEGELQSLMGLPADAFQQVILQVGNYDEIYARNLNPVGLSRDGSANAPWTEGGLIYAPPAR